MAEAAAELKHGDITDDERDKVRALTAATDNVALFFGEDVFLAIGSILLMVGFMQQSGIEVQPLAVVVLGDADRDRGVFCARRAIASFRPAQLKTKSEAGVEMITLQLRLYIGRRVVRRLRRFERARYRRTQNAGRPGCFGRCSRRAFSAATILATSATAFLVLVDGADRRRRRA